MLLFSRWGAAVGEPAGRGRRLDARPLPDFLGVPYYARTIGHSFLVSSLVTLSPWSSRVPVAFHRGAGRTSPARPVLTTLAILPLVSPPFIGAYSWILLFGRAGYVTSLSPELVGITIPTVYGMHGIVLALDAEPVPVRLLMVTGALRALDQSLEEAAQGLGSARGACSGR